MMLIAIIFGIVLVAAGFKFLEVVFESEFFKEYYPEKDQPKGTGSFVYGTLCFLMWCFYLYVLFYLCIWGMVTEGIIYSEIQKSDHMIMVIMYFVLSFVVALLAKYFNYLSTRSAMDYQLKHGLKKGIGYDGIKSVAALEARSRKVEAMTAEARRKKK